MMTSAESGEDGNNYGYRLPQNQEERLWAFQVALVVKNPPANAGRCKRCGFDPWVEKIPWKRAWQPTPVFLPGESLWTEEPGGLQSMGSHRVGHD